jgi:hypothetical protein
MLMEDDRIQELKDKLLWELRMEEKSGDELREQMYENLGEMLRDMDISENLDEIKENLETVLEIDDYLKRGGTKKVE